MGTWADSNNVFGASRRHMRNPVPRDEIYEKAYVVDEEEKLRGNMGMIYGLEMKKSLCPKDWMQ